MKRNCPKIIATVIIIFGLLVTIPIVDTIISGPVAASDIFVGLDIGYGDDQTAIEQIDKVADYINLIVLGSLDITMNTENLTRVCDYIFQKGLHFIVYVGFGEGSEDAPPRGPSSQFFNNAIDRYGNKFLGVYLFDEVGGKLMDGAHSVNLTAADTYSDAAILYTHHLNFYLGNVSQFYAPADFPLYTSDYALFWYNYVAGYDVVFTEYVGNQSREIATGLCRGAAKTLNKDWGVIITWSHELESFVENPEQLYDDMVLAYQNGAKYIVVFNSPAQFTPPTQYGTLTEKHLEKMQQFWNYIHHKPSVDLYLANTAFVLPKDYGYGFRGPDDKIWGKWEPDTLSPQVWANVQQLLDAHAMSLDIVYETRIDSQTLTLPYNRLIYWNGTVIQK